MAKSASSSTGGVIGLALGFLVLAGIAGTPFYLASLRDDARKLDVLVQDDVEFLRRVVLNLNAHRDQMAIAYRTLEAAGKPAKQEMNRLLQENETLLQQAETVLRQLVGKRAGEHSAGNHLAVNRLRSVFYLTAAQLELNQAQFEELQAEELRRTVGLRLGAVAALRRSREAMEARTPTEAIAQIKDRITQLEAEMTALSGQVDQLSGVVAATEARVAEQEQAAADARRRLGELEREGLKPALEQEYLRLSNTARAAEAEVDALSYGTLAGGSPSFQETEDWLNAPYEGGQPRLGLRDLKFGLELLKEQIALRQEMKQELVARQTAAEEAAEALAAHKQALQAKYDAAMAEIDELLAQAAKHAAAASKARGEALLTFERKAGEYARQALTAADKRTREATSALRDLGEATDERLQKISKDSAMAGTAQTLGAAAAYHTALLRLHELNALESAYEMEQLLAELAGRTAPPDISARAEELRTKAAADLKTAMEKLEDARNRMKTASARAADGTTVSGSNYMWSFDIAAAAVRLLEANLAGDKGTRLEAQKQAYQLLSEAAKDREQSPLLTPAIDAIRFLQQTVSD